MAVTAQQVKELREKTGAGMMDCKKALVEAGGDIDAAEDVLAKAGLRKAAKSAGRTAAEGVVLTDVNAEGVAVMIEVNSETDFVSRDGKFQAFCKQLLVAALKNQPADADALLASCFEGTQSVEDVRQTLSALIGENIQVRRLSLMKPQANQTIGQYVHMNRIGVLVTIEGGDAALAKDLAMQIAASQPEFISPDYVPEARLQKEKEILVAQAEASGKSKEIAEKMVVGRIKKFIEEICLVGQPFIKNPDITVETLLKEKNAVVTNYVRFLVGEGIEKEVKDFAEEVKTQLKGGA